MFQDRIAILGTMHGKERVIAPILAQEIGLKVIVPDNFDTDRFGTFTRDIKRIGTQIETARRKAQQAIELSGYDIGIASEGSFYPYPNLPLVSCNRELILLLDRVHNLEIIGQAIKVVVAEIDEYKNRISLSTKILEAHPGEILENFAEVMETAAERLKQAQGKTMDS